jgi:succinate dehydrogenase flavin-adding protein (antitoxin of CptAB toxin-antitoxin module)
MRELDVLLKAFLDGDYAELRKEDKERFELLLTLPDPELSAYLLGREEPLDAELARLVRAIRSTLHP